MANNFQQHWATIRNYLESLDGTLSKISTGVPHNVHRAMEALNQIEEEFVVLTVTRSELDYYFGDKVGERMTDGQMTEIAQHMEYNEFLCDEKEEALKFAMDVLHNIEPISEEEDGEEDIFDE